jgi:hypothetical protein
MATDLASLRDRVELILADSTNAIFSTGDVDEGIRRALHDYSQVNPQHKIGTITLAADGREISTSTLTGVIDVEDVWCPYTAADPEYPAYARPFRFWKDSAKLYVIGNHEPQSGEVVRVFYTALQALKDLDSAAATTLPAEHDSIVALGAAGYAAQSRALDITEQISVDRDSANRLRDWAELQLRRFTDALNRVAISTRGPGQVALPALDRWEGDWT